MMEWEGPRHFTLRFFPFLPNQSRGATSVSLFTLNTSHNEISIKAAQEHMDDLSKLVGSQNQKLAGVNMDLNEQKRHQEQALIGAEIAKVATLERELKKHK